MKPILADITFGGPESWAVFLFFSLASPLGIWRAGRLWRGHAPELEVDTAPWFPFFGPAFWHGYRRCQPLYAVALPLIFVPIGAWGALGSPGDLLFLGIALSIAFLGVLLLPLIFCVHVFAWPKWPIPPGHRHEPGAIVEWRDGIALRRRRERSS